MAEVCWLLNHKVRVCAPAKSRCLITNLKPLFITRETDQHAVTAPAGPTALTLCDSYVAQQAAGGGEWEYWRGADRRKGDTLSVTAINCRQNKNQKKHRVSRGRQMTARPFILGAQKHPLWCGFPQITRPNFRPTHMQNFNANVLFLLVFRN